jgi:hypothetical protein
MEWLYSTLPSAIREASGDRVRMKAVAPLAAARLARLLPDGVLAVRGQALDQLPYLSRTERSM